MRKFFVPQKNIDNGTVYIFGIDYNHIKNVLRLRAGDNIIVNNGNGYEYETKITSLENERITAEIIRQIELQSEPSVEIVLFQGIPKGDKMDLIIQKAVEVGVKKIVPLITERVIVKLDEKSERKKVERWQKISEQAAKQSGRNVIPEVTLPVKLKDCSELLKSFDLKFLFYENEKKQSIREIFNSLEYTPQNVAIIIGPEGGFGEEEIKRIKDVYVATLGPRILRTETAGLVAASIILYQMGEMG